MMLFRKGNLLWITEIGVNNHHKDKVKCNGHEGVLGSGDIAPRIL
jgi:hypothetical protein